MKLLTGQVLDLQLLECEIPLYYNRLGWGLRSSYNVMYIYCAFVSRRQVVTVGWFPYKWRFIGCYTQKSMNDSSKVPEENYFVIGFHTLNCLLYSSLALSCNICKFVVYSNLHCCHATFEIFHTQLKLTKKSKMPKISPTTVALIISFPPLGETGWKKGEAEDAEWVVSRGEQHCSHHGKYWQRQSGFPDGKIPGKEPVGWNREEKG